jgi:hypothetical protein
MAAKWKPVCGRMRKMKPPSTPDTQIGADRDGLNALPKRIIGNV